MEVSNHWVIDPELVAEQQVKTLAAQKAYKFKLSQSEY